MADSANPLPTAESSLEKDIEQRFGLYLATIEVGKQMNSDALDFVYEVAPGESPVTAAVEFVVPFLGYCTRNDQSRALAKARIWKDLSGSFWGLYRPGTFDCDFRMTSVRNQNGAPTSVTKTYKILLQLEKKDVQVSGRFTCNFYDWSASQDPVTSWSGDYRATIRSIFRKNEFRFEVDKGSPSNRAQPVKPGKSYSG